MTETASSLRASLEQLFAEDVESVRERERSAFDQLAGPWRDSIVLAGAGGLGRRCLAGLRRHGIEPVAFSDNNPKLWNTSIEGVAVLSPREAAQRFGKSAIFVVTIWGAHSPDRMSDRQSALRSLGCQNVIPFAPLFWKYSQDLLPHYAADLPHKVVEQASDVLRAFDLLADEQSRCEYVAQVRWRLGGSFDLLPPPERGEIYFSPEFVKLTPDEVYVDCGAFDGDTLDAFFRASDSTFLSVFAFEPDPANYEKLGGFVKTLSGDVQNRITLARAGVGAKNGRESFTAQGSLASHFGAGGELVEVVALDSALGEQRPTFIKMDIEGAEPEALLGARRHIQDASPLLAISCYHRQDHLWSIPLLIDSLKPGYKFYLRPHDVEGWDLVCYAVSR